MFCQLFEQKYKTFAMCQTVM